MVVPHSARIIVICHVDTEANETMKFFLNQHQNEGIQVVDSFESLYKAHHSVVSITQVLSRLHVDVKLFWLSKVLQRHHSLFEFIYHKIIAGLICFADEFAEDFVEASI